MFDPGREKKIKQVVFDSGRGKKSGRWCLILEEGKDQVRLMQQQFSGHP